MSENNAAERTATAVGESAMTGVRGMVGGVVAKPIAKRTRFTEQQVRAAIGLLILAWGVFQLVRTIRRARRNTT